MYYTDTYPPQVNGVSVVTALAVSGLRARGWKVAVVAPRYPANPQTGVRHFVNDFGTADMHIDVPSIPFPPYPDFDSPRRCTSASPRRFPISSQVWSTVRRSS